MYISKYSNRNTGFSDLIILISAVFLIVSVIVDFLYPESVVSDATSYVTVIFELCVSAYVVFYNRGVLKINVEGCVAIIYIISSFFFTLAHAGYSAAVLAVCKEYVVLFVCVFIRRGTYSIENFNRVLKLIIAFALLSIVVSIVRDDLIGKVVNFTNVYEADIKSFFGSKNQFGRLLYLSSVCSFFLSTYYTAKSEKRKYLVLTGILTLGTVLTFSRTSLLAVGIFFISYYLLTSKRNLRRNLIIMAAGLIVLYLIISSPFVSDYISDFIIRKETGIGSRSDIWMIGLDYIGEHPLAGSGEFMVEEIINRGGIDISEFHNTYIYRMVVSGIPVAMLFTVFIVKRFSVLKHNAENNPAMVCGMAMLISLLVYMCLEQYTLFRFSVTGIIVIMFLYVAPDIAEFNKEQ